MEFDWIDVPFDLASLPPKDIEETFEDLMTVGYLADTAIVYSEPDPTEVSLVEELELATRLLPPTFGPG